MDEGSAVLRKPIWDWLLFGLGFADLCFRKGEGRWSPVLEVGQVRTARRCEKCGMLIIDGEQRWPKR
jgi:hypothetical protein